MILKLERQRMEDRINRWRGIPYISEWKWDHRELSVNDITKDNYYDDIYYVPGDYKDFNDDIKMNFTWIEVVVKNAGETNVMYFITTLIAFILNDEGKTVERLS